MKIIYWNIRGLTNKPSRDSLFNVSRDFSPDIVSVTELIMSSMDFHYSVNFFAFDFRKGKKV